MGSHSTATSVINNINMSSLHPDSCYEAGARPRKKSSTVMGPNRKLSQDVSRKLSAISTAPDISALSDRLGMDQDHLKTIVKDILDMDSNNKWEVDNGEDGSEYGDDDEGWETDEQIWETVRIEQKKKDSTSSQASSSDDVVDINVEEFNDVLNLYMRHQISVTSFLHHEKNMR